MIATQAIKIRKESDQNKFIEIKVLDKIHKVRLKDIRYIIAEDSGLRIHTTSNSLWTKVTMKVFLDSLSDEGFIKIFRGTTINVRHIKWVNHASLMMNDDTELKIGRTYKDSILKTFES